jgi:hypothetical protein
MISLNKRVFLLLSLSGLTGLLLGCTQEPQQQSQSDRQLIEAIDQCRDTTERAAAHLVAVVEYQKLEIIGRKTRVFKMCMQDHGYIENKQWLTYSQPIAEKVAKQTNISVNEALENLRRTNMVEEKGEQDRPVYWLEEKPSKLSE